MCAIVSIVNNIIALVLNGKKIPRGHRYNFSPSIKTSGENNLFKLISVIFESIDLKIAIFQACNNAIINSKIYSKSLFP